MELKRSKIEGKQKFDGRVLMYEIWKWMKEKKGKGIDEKVNSLGHVSRYGDALNEVYKQIEGIKRDLSDVSYGKGKESDRIRVFYTDLERGKRYCDFTIIKEVPCEVDINLEVLGIERKS